MRGVWAPEPFPLAPCSANLRGMENTLELANFRGNDEPCLVEAALACRACLSGDVEWSLMVEEFEGQVECRCRDCGYARTVSLTSEQTLRLSLQPA
jgi:hypothetical protein